MLKARAQQEAATQAQAQTAPYTYPPSSGQGRASYPQEPKRPAGRSRDTFLEAMAKSAARSVGTNLGRQILRGVLGSIFGGRKR